MEYFSKDISHLIAELSQLPGIGQKSAQRLAFYIVNMNKDDAYALILFGRQRTMYIIVRSVAH